MKKVMEITVMALGVIIFFVGSIYATDIEYADVILDSYYSGANPDFDDFYGGTDQDSDEYKKVSPTIVLGNNEGFLSLPTGSYVVVGFTDNTIIDAPSQYDIFIDEVGGIGELADIYVSSDNENFVLLGKAGAGGVTSFDLGDIGFSEPVTAIKIVGLDNKGASPGFDLVSVSALEGAVGPASDADGDGMLDIWEIRYGLDPENYDDAVGDFDHDGLLNFFEFHYGTFPNKEDSDNDGVSDLIETINQTDPTDSSSVSSNDSDRDGMSNDWEINHGLNPENPNDGIADPDDDGLANLIEFIIGGDPFKPTELIINKNARRESRQDAWEKIGVFLTPDDEQACRFSATPAHINRNKKNKLPKGRIALDKDCKWKDGSGGEWKKETCGKSKYHQPEDIRGDSCVNDKFTQKDGTGGSYEAVQDENGNFIYEGELMGTYNYYDCDGTKSCFNHWVVDVMPHFCNSNYQAYSPPEDTPKYNEKAPDWGCKCEEGSSGVNCKCEDISKGCTPEPPENDSQVIGDPHFVTFDGLAYDFQAAGEFIFIESTLNPVEMTVQIRQQPLRNSRHVSVTTAVASHVKGDKVEIYLNHGPNLYVNNVPTSSETSQLELPNGGYLSVQNNVYKIIWSDYSQITFKVRSQRIDIYAAFTDERRDYIQGLSGNLDDDPTNDLSNRNGSIIFDTQIGFTKDILYGDFAESWRISQDESLFTYFSTDESTATYTDRNFPVEIITAKDLPEDQYNQGKTICENAGIIDPVMLDSCILDVGLTGDEDFVQGFLDANTPKVTITYEPVLPTVTSTTPSGNESEITVNTSVTVTFSKPMDASSITANTFILNNGIQGTVSYDPVNMTAKFEPSSKLAYNTTYTATISSAVKDVAGNAMLTDYTWGFTTIAEGATDDDDDDGDSCFISTVMNK